MCFARQKINPQDQSERARLTLPSALELRIRGGPARSPALRPPAALRPARCLPPCPLPSGSIALSAASIEAVCAIDPGASEAVCVIDPEGYVEQLASAWARNPRGRPPPVG